MQPFFCDSAFAVPPFDVTFLDVTGSSVLDFVLSCEGAIMDMSFQQAQGRETLLMAIWVFGHWKRQTAGKVMIQPFSAGMDSWRFEVFESWILGLSLAGDTSKLLELIPGTENQGLDWDYPKAWS